MHIEVNMDLWGTNQLSKLLELMFQMCFNMLLAIVCKLCLDEWTLILIPFISESYKCYGTTGDWDQFDFGMEEEEFVVFRSYFGTWSIVC